MQKKQAAAAASYKGSQSKESCGISRQKKEAAGSYRSRSPEGVPVERELRGGGAEEGSSRKL